MPNSFSNVTSCSLQDGQQHFVGICCFCIQGLPFYPEDEDINQLRRIISRNILSQPCLNLQFYSNDR
jgi:hypothetical protein